MNTLHTCYRTKESRAAMIAGWVLATFPAATILALALWGDWLYPYLAMIFGV